VIKLLLIVIICQTQDDDRMFTDRLAPMRFLFSLRKHWNEMKFSCAAELTVTDENGPDFIKVTLGLAEFKLMVWNLGDLPPADGDNFACLQVYFDKLIINKTDAYNVISIYRALLDISAKVSFFYYFFNY
jgi:hypothetical protein